MRIEALRYLLEVEKTGSLSKAAENLFMTHSALSAAISNIEDSLGYKIFTRGQKGSVPTELGEEALMLIKELLVIYEKIEHLETTKGKKPVIDIASIATLSNNVLLPAIMKFKKDDIEVGVRSHEMQPQEVIESVIANQCQIGISFIELEEVEVLIKKIVHEKLIWEPLYKDELCLYVNKRSKLLEKERVSPEDLDDVIAVSINHRQFSTKRSYYINKIDDQFQLSFTNQEVIKKLIAESNDGSVVAFLPKLLSYGDYYIKSGDLIPIELDAPLQEILYFLIYKTELEKNSLAMTFISSIKKEFDNVKNAVEKDCSITST